jgi:hypothetical protein
MDAIFDNDEQALEISKAGITNGREWKQERMKDLDMYV